jgi:5-oxoprolinase (ATP-hydrolysing) subunit C
VIEVASVAGLTTVQDAGRSGRMHEGIPPGGPLVPEMLARANAAVHNAPGEAALEVFGAITVVARGPVVLGADDGAAATLREGESFSLSGTARGPRARYLALRGGVDVPRVLGGKGTLLVARLGGHEGRPLRRGDLLRAGAAAPVEYAPPAAVEIAALVEVVLGPDVDRFGARAVDTLLVSAFAVDVRSDRVGTRLSGPKLVCDGDPGAVSTPMVRGAIQVPPSGEPIVLGPDHPTTGGYPVIATVVRRHLGAIAGRPVGAAVRFVIG